jgi:hypothetical protein
MLCRMRSSDPSLVAQTGEFTFGQARMVEPKGMEGSHQIYPVVVSTG